jgi:hypothetical protein
MVIILRMVIFDLLIVLVDQRILILHEYRLLDHAIHQNVLIVIEIVTASDVNDDLRMKLRDVLDLEVFQKHPCLTIELVAVKTKDISTNQEVDVTKTTKKTIRRVPPQKTENEDSIQLIKSIFSMSLEFMVLLAVQLSPKNSF